MHANPAVDQEPILEHHRSHRMPLRVAGRITWRDRDGYAHSARVVTRDVADYGAYVECEHGPQIPLYRLVELTLDRGGRAHEELPTALRRRSVWSAVYRVEPLRPETGRSYGYALRLLVEPPTRVDAPARPQVATLSAWARKHNIVNGGEPHGRAICAS